MSFKSREENGGELDHRINKSGRPKGSGKKLNRGEIRDKELIALLRKVKPHLAKSYMEVAKILNKEEALKIIKLLSALESWAFSTKNMLPDYLHEELSRALAVLEKIVLEKP